MAFYRLGFGALFDRVGMFDVLSSKKVLGFFDLGYGFILRLDSSGFDVIRQKLMQVFERGILRLELCRYGLWFNMLGLGGSVWVSAG